MYVISISTASSTRGRPDKSRVVFWGNERVCVRATPPVRCATNARGGYYVCGWLWTRETQHLPSKKEKEQSQWTSIAMRGRNMCSHEKARENERKKHKSRCNEHARPLSSLTSQRKPKKKSTSHLPHLETMSWSTFELQESMPKDAFVRCGANLIQNSPHEQVLCSAVFTFSLF